MADFKETHWALLDLQYEYLDDGFKLTATTDVPCHLYCRMTTTAPVKRMVPSRRRGTYLQGDIRFCFVVYEDNEQDEAGDTLTHTWLKSSWPICETRWFYFVGTQGGTPSVSETAIFKFHFPAPPPAPPPPIQRLILANDTNRFISHSSGAWATAHDNATGLVWPTYDAPLYELWSGDYQVATYHIRRGFLDFDTEVLPDTYVPLSAFICVYCTTIDSNVPARPNLYITEGKQSLPPVSADYGGQLPYTQILGQADLSTFTLNAYNEIPFNVDGINLISTTALSRFCLRGQNDVEDFASVPIYRNYIVYHSQQKGIGFRPYLKINYYPA